MEEKFLKTPTQEPQEATTDIAVSVKNHHHGSPPQISSGDASVLSGDEDVSDDSDGEFEFPFVSRDNPAAASAADELFADGRIRPFYPVFGRPLGAPPAPSLAPRATVRQPLGRLFLEEARNSSIGSTSSSSASSAATDAGDLDGVSPESYCLWVPGSSASASSSPGRPPRKSGSTGSMARWRRISELVIGRSHSDGKEKFVFLSPPQAATPNSSSHHHHKEERTKARSPATGGGNKVTTEVDAVTAGHRIAYGAKSSGGGGGGTRRTFLPYRPELFGLFANVNGLSRSHNHPF